MAFQLFRPSTWFARDVAPVATDAVADDVFPDQSLIGADAPVQTDAALLDAAALNAVPAPLPIPANDAAEISMDEVADETLGHLLSTQKVTNALTGSKQNFPVKGVSLGAFGNGAAYVSLEPAGTLGERVRLTIDLFERNRVGTYTQDSIQHAVQAMLANIPILSGKFVEEDLKQKAPSYAELRTQLEAAITRHPEAFTAEEIAALKSMLNQHEDKMGIYSGAQLAVTHPNGMVVVKLQPFEAFGADKPDTNVSTDHRVMEYFNNPEFNQSMLNAVKQKVIALNVPGVDEAALANLSMRAIQDKDNGWCSEISIQFGVKNAQTGVFEATPLAGINTEKLSAIFKDAMIDESKSLPAVLPQLANGEILGKILKARLGNDPEITKMLELDFFKGPDAYMKKIEKNAHEGKVRLPEVLEGVDKHKLVVDFDLPKGVTLADLRKDLALNGKQAAVAMPSAGAGLSAA